MPLPVPLVTSSAPAASATAGVAAPSAASRLPNRYSSNAAPSPRSTSNVIVPAPQSVTLTVGASGAPVPVVVTVPVAGVPVHSDVDPTAVTVYVYVFPAASPLESVYVVTFPTFCGPNTGTVVVALVFLKKRSSSYAPLYVANRTGLRVGRNRRKWAALALFCHTATPAAEREASSQLPLAVSVKLIFAPLDCAVGFRYMPSSPAAALNSVHPSVVFPATVHLMAASVAFAARILFPSVMVTGVPPRYSELEAVLFMA